MEGMTEVVTCVIVVFVVFELGACYGLYSFWKRNLRGKALTRPSQVITLLGWLFLMALPVLLFIWFFNLL
jgi:hypothetical protein